MTRPKEERLQRRFVGSSSWRCGGPLRPPTPWAREETRIRGCQPGLNRTLDVRSAMCHSPALRLGHALTQEDNVDKRRADCLDRASATRATWPRRGLERHQPQAPPTPSPEHPTTPRRPGLRNVSARASASLKRSVAANGLEMPPLRMGAATQGPRRAHSICERSRGARLFPCLGPGDGARN